MKKSFSLLVILLLLSGCNSGSSSAHDPTKKILHINSAAEPPSMDPRVATDHPSLTAIMMTIEGLTRENPDGVPEPCIAKSIEISPDKKHYTFHLRDTKWSNGKKLTAYDFEETWKHTLHPQFPAQFAYLMYVIKNGAKAKKGLVSIDEVGVTAVDALTLEVELENPVPYFTWLVSTHVYLPYPKYIAKINDEALVHNQKKSYVGNGPFLVEKFTMNHSMLLQRNPHYWDAENVHLDGINMSFVADQASVLEMFEKGELDWIGDPVSSLPEDSKPFLRKKQMLSDYPIAAVYYYVFNTKKYPFTNEKIRKAFNLAIDRAAIVEHVTHKSHSPALRLLPEVMTGTSREYYNDADLTLAKELFAEGLQELGIGVAEFPAIPLKYNNTYPLHYRIAQAVQQQWREAFSIRVDLESRDWTVFLDDLIKGNFLIARLGGGAIYNDPLSFLESFVHENGNINYSRWNNHDFNEMINNVNFLSSRDERMEQLQKAEEILMREMPVAPIFFYNVSYMQKKNVKDVYVSSLGRVDYKWADIEPLESGSKL